MLSNVVRVLVGIFFCGLVLTGCQSTSSGDGAAPIVDYQQTNERAMRLVVMQYANVAHATYDDALNKARALRLSIRKLISSSDEDSLARARAAWKVARVPYQQSEVFRFGNGIVDDWEGQLNAWPLDEGLIDYVSHDDYDHVVGNVGATANVIASEWIEIGDKTIDLREITPELIAGLNEFGGSEANVATGYHAIEFLLWGQDLNGVEAGAGERPASDFIRGDGCTHGHCERRVAYLTAAIELLISDLTYMVGQWSEEGAYRQQLLSESPVQGLRKMLFGMGSLSLGELAGERMKVALEANSTEDEHDCFSDNTHFSHYYNAKGIQNVYLGEYTRTDGRTISGPGLASLVKEKSPQIDTQLRQALETTMAKMQAMVDRAEASQNPMKFDMMIAEGNNEGRKLISDAIYALVAQTALIEQAAEALKVGNLNPESADHVF